MSNVRIRCAKKKKKTTITIVTCWVHGDQMDVHGKIREVLSESLKDDLGYGPHSFSEGDFLQALQRRGIIDDVMRDLQFSQVTHQ